MPNVLECLDRCEIPYAILHGADRIHSRSVVSDIDVVVGVSPRQVIRTVSQCLEDAGLVPIMEWPYDVGGTLTVFLATLDGREAVQLDMLHDPRGVGKYAVRSDVLLRRAERRDGLAVVAPIDELVYLLRKRTVKGDDAALSILREQASRFPPRELEESIRSTLSPHGRWTVNSQIAGAGGVGGVRPINRLLNVARGLSRLFRPTGFWVHCSDPQSADALVGRFAAYLPNAASLGSISSPSQMANLVWRRLRPGVVVTHGQRPRMLTPDAVVEDASLEDAARMIIGVFRNRTEQRLGAA